MSTAGSRPGRRFLRIVDDEHARASTTAPWVPPAREDSVVRAAGGGRLFVGVVIGAAAAVSVGLIWRRRPTR